MKNYFMEFLGTFFLVLAIGLTGEPLAIGLMLMAMVYIGGHISGAHYNSAVSLSMLIKKAISKKTFFIYCVVQVLAAFIASLLIFSLRGVLFVPSIGANVGIWQALAVEILFTFVLASVILAITSKRFANNSVYGFAIGLTLFAIAFAGGPISGGVYNPAVELGSMLNSIIFAGIFVPYFWIYLAGPLIGGIAAAYIFKYLNPKG